MAFPHKGSMFVDTRCASGWLLAGGLIYTAGGIIYALKLPIFNMKHKDFGSHEIFHLFVMGGSICHFVVMYAFVLYSDFLSDVSWTISPSLASR